MLSRLVITFLPRSKHLLISWLQSPSAVILEPPKIKSGTVSLFPHLFPMKWWDRMPWSSFSECWALSQLFHSPLSLLALVNSNKWFVGRSRLCWHPVSDEFFFFSASCSVHWWLSPFHVWGRHLLWGWALSSHLYICQYGVMDSYFIQWVAIPLSSFFLLLLLLKLCQIWLVEASSNCRLVSLQAVSFCYVFLIPWTLP